MQTSKIHEPKTQLSRLVEQAAKGESFVIAKAGQVTVPEAGIFNSLGRDEIVAAYTTSPVRLV